MRKPAEFENFTEAHAVSFGPYRAFCYHVTDGDTIDVSVDLGLNSYRYMSVRVRDVDTAEIFGRVSAEERTLGLRAKQFVESVLLLKPCVIATHKDTQTFGRYVADVWYFDSAGAKVFLADQLRAFVFPPADAGAGA